MPGTHSRNLPAESVCQDLAIRKALKHLYFFQGPDLARNVPFLPGRRPVGSPPGSENRAR